MRQYENPQMTSENRCAPRSYYIPGGISQWQMLNGQWNFAFFHRDVDVPEQIEQWDTITTLVPDDKEHQEKYRNSSLNILIFAQSKNLLGQVTYRFMGVYAFDKSEKNKSND